MTHFEKLLFFSEGNLQLSHQGNKNGEKVHSMFTKGKFSRSKKSSKILKYKQN